MGGRIADIAIHPQDESTWYVAVGSGGVFKTTNNGISWQAIFENKDVYSTGCITLDPSNPSTVWLGTGENVGGRHVGFGDGIYRSTDGGKNWQNMGLKKSEHLSKIIVHPSNSDIIWVAAQGPLWSQGGQRGFYKTTNGGKTWQRTLGDDEWTGVTDILIDPRNPKRLYAATWQRHRTVAAYLGGGPKTALYRSEDGGDTWTQLKSGLPSGNKGKIGLALSPQNPDVVYAAIELNHREGGVYKSTNRGATWAKQSDAVSGATGPHYYQELYASPHQEGRLYLMDVRAQVSEDGGKTFNRMPEKFKHSDNHAMAFKSSDPNYLLFGTDGGLYESFDLGKNWRFINNLPITQFYKLAVDDAQPFYNIYGGTQDNNTQGGPSRTDNPHGIQNSDWKVVLYADGHQPATEPGNPNIMYAQWQQGSLTRIDLASGEVTYIRPQPGEDEPHERYNWDAPILVSPHSPTTIFHGSQRLWRSTNRGDSWETLSDDLTRNQERIELPIMGKQQSWDNAWDFYAMSTFNTITSIAQSPVEANTIWVGTDDGLLQKTTDGGQNWQKIETNNLPGAPKLAYVNDIKADLFDANTVYVALSHHKAGDFSPYLYKSTNGGKSWSNIGQSLPAKHLVWRLVQDHKNKNLLFIGTEFGLFFSHNAGQDWTKLKGGVPTISFRDLTIQRQHNDLVAASFGRSFYVLDDISPLRQVSEESLSAEAQLFAPRKTYWYYPRPHLSFGEGKGSQGEAHFLAPNPEFGAVFTYHLSQDYPSAKSRRQKKEKELAKENANIPFPGWAALAAEEQDLANQLWLVITNAEGDFVRKLKAPAGKGFHRLAWDLHYADPGIIREGQKENKGKGMPAGTGTYFGQLYKQQNGKLSPLGQAQEFEVVPLHQNSINNPMGGELQAFRRAADSLTRMYSAFSLKARKTEKLYQSLSTAYQSMPGLNQALAQQFAKLNKEVYAFRNGLYGNPAKNKIGEKTNPTLGDRIQMLGMNLSRNNYGPTPHVQRTREIFEKQFAEKKAALKKLEKTMQAFADAVVAAGGPQVEGFY
jgi:photosystem II stability/assembly factor-like uncharacterized protein